MSSVTADNPIPVDCLSRQPDPLMNVQLLAGTFLRLSCTTSWANLESALRLKGLRTVYPVRQTRRMSLPAAIIQLRRHRRRRC